ncbi:M20 family metallopeptidase [Dactylosporangium sp. CA-092794]|uniref:M20 family metallopeptidase n=1 Tax=Dactylosporangium sp. CA-092794 TaxID=3239929 RepID=UPI003D945695
MTGTDPSGEQRREWIERAWAQLDDARLIELVAGMVGIPSPTGEEGDLARWLAERLREAGLEGRYQPIDATQGNAAGRLRGDGSGADLLLYAPIDTLTVGTAEEDVPWIGDALRPDMRPEAIVDGDYVLGLGASNPKGHGACVIAAAEAIRKAAVPLRGELFVGLGAGGMPTNKRTVPRAQRYNAGQGNGVSFLLEQGLHPHFALIAKPGWAVSHDEVGLCWFEVRVRGTFSYVGSRHRMSYRNPIVHAATVVQALERWFPQYTARHTEETVAPQGNIGAIEGGWPRMPSVSPALCRLRVDLRTRPAVTPAQVRAEFRAAIEAIAAEHPELDLDWDMVLSIPGTATPADSWIVRAAVEAWQAIEDRPHVPIAHNSGATDANILRGRGVPTARIGMDRIGPGAPLPLDFPSGMNVVDVREMRRLARHLIHTAVNTCTRTREELA